MANSFFIVIFLVILNTIPSNIKEFRLYTPKEKDKPIELSWSDEKGKWIVDDDSGTDGNSLGLTDKHLIVEDRGKIDTFDIHHVMPDYEKIKWKRLKEYKTDEGLIRVEKNKKDKTIRISFGDPNNDEGSMEMFIEWGN